MDDICPHRLAPLSEGRVYQRHHEGRKQTILECGYHGWRFDCTGRCVDIPVAQLSKRIPAAADIDAIYATRVARFGLIFMWWGKRAKADDAKLPVPHDLDKHDDIFVFRSMTRKFPLAFTTVLENIADPAHVPWAHHGSRQGDRNKVSRSGEFVVMEDRIKDGYVRVSFGQGEDALYATGEILMPTAVHITIKIPTYDMIMVTWTSPADWERCTLFSSLIVVNAPRALKWLWRFSPRWMEHISINLILDGDAMLLQGQEKNLQDLKRDGLGGAWKKNYVLASGKWDTEVIKLREFLDMYGPSLPFRTPPSESRELLSREAVIDRYENHTKDCACCAPALRNIRRGLVVTFIVAGLCVMISLFAGVMLASVGTEYLGRIRLMRIGIAGMIGCLLALGLARVLSRYEGLLTFTDISYRLSHAD